MPRILLGKGHHKWCLSSRHGGVCPTSLRCISYVLEVHARALVLAVYAPCPCGVCPTSLLSCIALVSPRCGEDFYIAVTDGLYAPFTQVTSAWTSTDEDIRNEDAMRRFNLTRAAMEKRFGSQVWWLLS